MTDAAVIILSVIGLGGAPAALEIWIILKVLWCSPPCSPSFPCAYGRC